MGNAANKGEGPATGEPAARDKQSRRRASRAKKKGARKAKHNEDEAEEEDKTPGCFTLAEAKQIRESFKRLAARKASASYGTGYVTVEDVAQVPELAFNPLVGRVAEVVRLIMDRPGLEQDQMDVDMFLAVLAVFHPATEIEEKQLFTFRVFDHDGDGQISREDYVYVLSCIFPGLALGELEIQADLAFEASDCEEGGLMSPQDFFKLFDAQGFADLLYIEMH